jgi:hypothetical protein
MYHTKYLKYKEKYIKLKNQLGGEIVQLNGNNYLKKRYSDLVVTFLLGRKKLREFNDTDVFIRFNENNTFNTGLSFLNIYERLFTWRDTRCIRLFRVDEIIELPELVGIVGMHTGVYRVLAVNTNNNYPHREIGLRLLNLNTNIEHFLVLNSTNDHLFKLDTVYLYIPILSEHDKIHKNIKHLNEDRKFSSNIIIKKLWDNRENGDYNFNGLQVDSFILKLSCEFIKTQIQTELQRKDDSIPLGTDSYNNPEIKDCIYLFVYLMYHNNFIGCSVNINYDNLECIRHMCDYYLVDQNIINYIDILRSTTEFDPLGLDENSEE